MFQGKQTTRPENKADLNIAPGNHIHRQLVTQVSEFQDQECKDPNREFEDAVVTAAARQNYLWLLKCTLPVSIKANAADMYSIMQRNKHSENRFLTITNSLTLL